MSVGIVGLCENGRYAVVACDAALSYGTQSADVGASKIMWYGDWCFLFAGCLSSTEVTMENIRQGVQDDPTSLSRGKIVTTVRRAYSCRVAQWNSVRHLSTYGLEMEDFKKHGRKIFGSKVAAELARGMYEDYQQNFADEILVIGWGKTPHASLLYSISPAGDGIHGKDGMMAIGSGRDAALATLFHLGHGMGSPLSEAIYAVAAAKFSSETHGIGCDTRIWIGRKRLPTDDAARVPGLILQPGQIEELRGVWNAHGKPRIPTEAKSITRQLSAQLDDEQVTSREAVREFGEVLETFAYRDRRRKPTVSNRD